uniref:G_PROTEIN_RECEP_F1_2 domain-containing protein n=1 Tax=Heterorhabditis bacteriophora TaxID=37862 RepID=A0A1I7X8M9_HETBA
MSLIVIWVRELPPLNPAVALPNCPLEELPALSTLCFVRLDVFSHACHEWFSPIMNVSYPKECPYIPSYEALNRLCAVGIIDSFNFTGCLPQCGICTHPLNEDDYITYNLIISGVILPLIGLLGLIGNGLSAFIYSRPEMRVSTNLYLCALGCSDSAVIITGIFLFFIDSVQKFSLSLTRLFGSTSLFALVPIALLRYENIYYKYMYAVFLAMGPLIILVVLNIFIIGASIFRTGGTSTGDTISLILVVLLFITCNVAALLLNTFEAKIIESIGPSINYIVDLSNLLVVFNSRSHYAVHIKKVIINQMS